jgi:PhzF family phenazine biosynthesis protein
MRLPIYQVDAFADGVFTGNPAAVCPLESWLADDLMQAIAQENNLAETAFFVAEAPGRYRLRWFTPAAEVDLCGHATLASAHVVFSRLHPDLAAVTFDTRSGPLTVTRTGDGLMAMDMPALPPESMPREESAPILDHIGEALGARPYDLWRAVNLLALYETEAELRSLTLSSRLEEVLADAGYWGLIVTAPADSDSHDFVSRFFAPAKGVPEDPVTGSAHCTLAPYWSAVTGQREVVGYQASARGGTVHCAVASNRVTLKGRCADYLEGTITV